MAQLHIYVDVVVFSTKGSRSALSWLGGGDYDGDTVLIIWEPALVNQFTNSPTCLGDPPEDFLEKNFDREVKPASELLDKLSSLAIQDRDAALQKPFLAGIGAPPTVGQYSNL